MEFLVSMNSCCPVKWEVSHFWTGSWQFADLVYFSRPGWLWGPGDLILFYGRAPRALLKFQMWCTPVTGGGGEFKKKYQNVRAKMGERACKIYDPQGIFTCRNIY